MIPHRANLDLRPLFVGGLFLTLLENLYSVKENHFVRKINSIRMLNRFQLSFQQSEGNIRPTN